MDVGSQEKCIAALQQLADSTAIQRLEQDGYFYQASGGGKGYVDVDFARNREVDLLQEHIIAIFNNLRAGMREKDKHKMADATGIRLENLQKYGYPAIGELFRPHVTLTKFPIEIEPDLTVLPSTKAYDGKFPRLGLFEMGPNGTCIRQIATYSLQDS